MLTEMEQQLQAIVTVLSLVNPLICGVMFAQIEAGQTRAIRITDATKAALAVLVILLVAALAGARVLQIFGISLDAFSIAGGGVLTWIGFSMLRGNTPQANAPSKGGAAEKRSLTPLILFAASPGTITGVITLAVAHAKLELPVTALVAVALAVAVMWIVMVLLARGGPHAIGGGSLLHDMVTRFMGLIVLAMGVQFALTGLRNFFS
jgi:multiple antibiotic resistance protein